MKYFALKDISLTDRETINRGNTFYSNIKYPSDVAVQVDEAPNLKPSYNKLVDVRVPITDKVEIILVRYNLKEVEDKAIRLVKENTDYSYKLTVVNNYKKDIPLSLLWNILIRKSKCKYICLLNSDSFVTKGWLTEIMGGFEYNNIAAVGPSGDKVGGKQRDIGTEKLASQYQGQYKDMIGKDTLSGFCLVLKKAAWKESGGFPKEIPFYGGEHALLVAIREVGYNLLWAQGSFVYHLGEASAKKAGVAGKLRKEGPLQYLHWLVKRIPILFITYNRLDYTKRALKELLKNTPGNEIFIFDNNSTDGTQEWLKGLKNKRLKIVYAPENIGVSGAMYEFFEATKNKEYVAKVDNDTLIPKKWLETLLAMAEHYRVDILQPKHAILHPQFNTFEEWMETLEGDYRIRYSGYVGGSGILVRRAYIENFIPEARVPLGGWTQYQLRHPEIKKVFCMNIEIELLDMTEDNKYNFDKYPDYYVEVGRKTADWVVPIPLEIDFPLVSILIPNKEGREVKCLDSIKAQTYENIEYLVSVDTGKGKNWAINNKIGELKGKYFFICDDDITLDHRCIEKMVQVLEDNEDISFCYCDYFRVGGKSGILKSEPFNPKNLENHNYISAMSLVRMRDIVPRDETVLKYTDWDCWRTLVDQGKIGKYIPEILFSAYYAKGCLSLMPDNEEEIWYNRVRSKHKRKERAEKIKVRTVFETLDTILGKLDKKFVYTRFGDGEILLLSDWVGREDYQLNSSELRKELRESINIDSPNYLIGSSAGMQNEKKSEKGLFARFDNDNELQDIIRDVTNKREFYNPISLHYLMVFYPNIFKSFLQELKKYKLGLVSKKSIGKVRKYLGIKEWVEVPRTQAYNTIDEWYPKVANMDVDIILISAGIATNVVQKRLWEKVSTIDMGSVCDGIYHAQHPQHNIWQTWIRMALPRLTEAFNES